MNDYGVNGWARQGFTSRIGLSILVLSGSVQCLCGQSNPLLFVPVTPCRVVNTLHASGPFGGPSITGGTSRDFNIPSGACNIPSTAQAYSLNVTVVPSGPLGYLTLWPTGQTLPAASILNSADGRVKSSAAIVAAGNNGSISVFASNTTDAMLDIGGYFVSASANPPGLAFYPIAPCRITDTRTATAPLGGPSLVGGQSRTFPIQSGTCNLPAAAQGWSLNFTAMPPGPLGYLTAFATGTTKPPTSSLNAPTGTVVANAAIVAAGAGGSIDIFATDNTDLIIDVNGYFAPMGPGGLYLFPVTPCRVLNTRQPSGSPPVSSTLVVNTSNQTAASACGVPVAAQAVVLAVTAIPPGALGYLKMWAAGQPMPSTSTLNALDAAVTSNMAIVGANYASIGVFPSNPTHLTLDVSGYFGPSPGSTVSAADSSANGNHGVLENGVAFAAGGMAGVGAASFNGANTYIDLGTSSTLMPPGGITASAWIKASSAQAAVPMILSAGDSTGGTGYNLYLWQGHPAFIVKEPSYGWGNCYKSGPTLLNDSVWHLVTGVYTGSTIAVYVDGVLAGIAACANQGANYGSGPRGEIGWKLDAATNDDFNGALGEVRLSNLARPTEWIAAEYANQAAPGTFSMTGATQALGVSAPFSITGQVTAVQSGSTINLTGVTMTLTGAASRSVPANAGSYGFANLTPGSYTVTPSWPGASFSPTSSTVTFTAGQSSQSASLSFTAAGMYTISGNVGLANPNVQVTLTGGPAGSPAVTHFSDNNGNYSFSGLFGVSYVVTPLLAGYTFGNASVTLSGSQTVSFTAVPVPYVISGQLKDQNSNPQNLVYLHLTGGSTDDWTQTNGYGNYWFTSGLVAGISYTIAPLAVGPSSWTPSSIGITLSPSSPTVTGVDFTQGAAPVQQQITTWPITGLQLTVSDQTGIRTCTSPCYVYWMPGQNYQISAASQVLGSTQYVFLSWSDGGLPTHNAMLGVTLTANYAASGTLTIATQNLPSGTMQVPYSQTLNAAGGPTPYTWVATPGTPPPGLGLSLGGILSGVPTVAGTYNLGVRVTDHTGLTANASLTLTILSPATLSQMAVWSQFIDRHELLVGPNGPSGSDGGLYGLSATDLATVNSMTDSASQQLAQLQAQSLDGTAYLNQRNAIMQTLNTQLHSQLLQPSVLDTYTAQFLGPSTTSIPNCNPMQSDCAFLHSEINFYNGGGSNYGLGAYSRTFVEGADANKFTASVTAVKESYSPNLNALPTDPWTVLSIGNSNDTEYGNKGAEIPHTEKNPKRGTYKIESFHGINLNYNGQVENLPPFGDVALGSPPLPPATDSFTGSNGYEEYQTTVDLQLQIGGQTYSDGQTAPMPACSGPIIVQAVLTPPLPPGNSAPPITWAGGNAVDNLHRSIPCPSGTTVVQAAIGANLQVAVTLQPVAVTLNTDKIVSGVGSQFSVTATGTPSTGGTYTWEVLGDDPTVSPLPTSPPNCTGQSECTLQITATPSATCPPATPCGGQATIRVHFTAADGTQVTADTQVFVVKIILTEVSWAASQSGLRKDSTAVAGWSGDTFGSNGTQLAGSGRIIPNGMDGTTSVLYTWQTPTGGGNPTLVDPVWYKMHDYPAIGSATINIVPATSATLKVHVEVSPSELAFPDQWVTFDANGHASAFGQPGTGGFLSTKSIDTVHNQDYTLTWKASFDGGQTWPQFATSTQKMFVSFGPFRTIQVGSSYQGIPTAKRMDYATRAAEGKSTITGDTSTGDPAAYGATEAVVSAVSTSLPWGSFVLGISLGNSAAFWSLLDTNPAAQSDCLALAGLAAFVAAQLGVQAGYNWAYPPLAPPTNPIVTDATQASVWPLSNQYQDHPPTVYSYSLGFYDPDGGFNEIEGFMTVLDGVVTKAFTVGPPAGPILPTLCDVFPTSPDNLLRFNVISKTLIGLEISGSDLQLYWLDRNFHAATAPRQGPSAMVRQRCDPGDLTRANAIQ